METIEKNEDVVGASTRTSGSSLYIIEYRILLFTTQK